MMEYCGCVRATGMKATEQLSLLRVACIIAAYIIRMKEKLSLL